MKGNRSMQDMTEGRPISLILKFFFPLFIWNVIPAIL